MTTREDGLERTAKRAALYICDTMVGQEGGTDRQEQVLRAYADQMGLVVVVGYRDQGVATTTGKRRRSGLDAMLRGAADGRFDVVLAGSLSSLGRTLDEITTTVSRLRSFGIILHLHDEGIDTSTESGRAFSDAAVVLDNARKALLRERVMVGQRRAKLAGVRIGRPPVAPSKLKKAREALASGEGVRAAARASGISPAKVLRIKRDMEGEIRPR